MVCFKVVSDELANVVLTWHRNYLKIGYYGHMSNRRKVKWLLCYKKKFYAHSAIK